LTQAAGGVSTNTAVGTDALAANTTGANNTAVGYQAGDAITTGALNTAVGSTALSAVTTGLNNTAVGAFALDAATGSGNTGIGSGALGASGNTASNNTAVGFDALNANTTGANNTAVGYQSLFANTTGANNTAVGYQALDACTTGQSNTAVGVDALGACTTGFSNVAVGRFAGAGITTGNENVCLGFGAGDLGGVVAGGVDLTTGYDNIYIGYYVGGNGGANINEIAIIGTNGSGAIGKGSNTAFISANGGSTFNGANSSSWNTTSDRRIKKNIVDNDEGLEKINGIRVRNFEYRLPEEVDPELKPSDTIKKEGIQLGVIAQELAEVCPDCVKAESSGVLTVQTDEIFWHMVNAIKELKAEVDALKAQLATPNE
jgi:hypothetical protein